MLTLSSNASGRGVLPNRIDPGISARARLRDLMHDACQRTVADSLHLVQPSRNVESRGRDRVAVSKMQCL